MSEWQLLIDAEDIQIGDSVIVETEDGRVFRWRVLRWTRKHVWLKDDERDSVHKFNTETLASDEDAVIQCKAD